jgi:biopolymer transport protein ExbD
LNLPSTDSVVQESGPEFSLEVIVRSDAIEVGDRNAGVLSSLPLLDGEYDLEGLNAYLKRVKASFPDELAVTLLLESEVDYEVLVKVMDAVRTYRVEEPGNFSRAELFPEISIGDAPLLAQGR